MGVVDVPRDSKVPRDRMAGGTTCIIVDGSGGCPIRFQGPTGQDGLHVYL